MTAQLQIGSQLMAREAGQESGKSVSWLFEEITHSRLGQCWAGVLDKAAFTKLAQVLIQVWSFSLELLAKSKTNYPHPILRIDCKHGSLRSSVRRSTTLFARAGSVCVCVCPYDSAKFKVGQSRVGQ